MDIGQKKAGIIGEIETRLNLLITIGVFLPTLAYIFSRFAGQPENIASKSALQWGLLVAMFIAIYFLFELEKGHLSTNGFAFLKISSLLTILLCAVPIYIFAYSNHPISTTRIYIFIGSIGLLFTIPFVTLIYLLFNLLKNLRSVLG